MTQRLVLVLFILLSLASNVSAAVNVTRSYLYARDRNVETRESLRFYSRSRSTTTTIVEEDCPADADNCTGNRVVITVNGVTTDNDNIKLVVKFDDYLLSNDDTFQFYVEEEIDDADPVFVLKASNIPADYANSSVSQLETRSLSAFKRIRRSKPEQTIRFSLRTPRSSSSDTVYTVTSSITYGFVEDEAVE